MVPNKMTRHQVHEKFQRNFQALCARCPQLGKNQDTLDDSLTSLKWLCNLNVNIGNPMDQGGKSGSAPRNGALLPPFSHNLINPLECNVVPPPAGNAFSALDSTSKPNLSNRANIFDSQRTTFAKAGSHLAGQNRALSRNGRKTSAPTMGRPAPPSHVDSNGRTISTSAGPTKVHRHFISQPIHSDSLPTQSISGNSFRGVRRPANGNDFPVSNVSAVKTESTPTAQLPQIQTMTSNLKKPGKKEPSDATSCNYSFSPREVMLDLLPGQVDYKNNPFVKPSFSYTTLICMAMQSNKRHRMSFTTICKWITDNFMYYRYADPSWQNSVRLNLTQSKYFSKVQKKKDPMSKNCQWEINPNISIRLRDIGSPLSNEIPQRNSPRLEPVNTEISPSTSIALSSVQSMVNFEPDECFSLNGRKRKQTTPQKVVRRRSGNAKKRRNITKPIGNHNLLQEEAPELGSLKGDFNWNTIFDEFFDTPEAELSVTPNSLASRPSTKDGNESQELNIHLAKDGVSGSLLTHDMLILPDLPEPVNDENSATSTSPAPGNQIPLGHSIVSSLVHPQNGHLPLSEKPNPITSGFGLPLIQECDLYLPENNNEDSELDTINGFLKDVEELDLTITGHQIAPPADWIPVCPDLDTILCEKQNDTVYVEVSPTSSNEIDKVFALPHNNPDQYLSPRKSNSREGRKMKKTGASLPRSTSCSPQLNDLICVRRPWQLANETSQTIDSLLSSAFPSN